MASAQEAETSSEKDSEKKGTSDKADDKKDKKETVKKTKVKRKTELESEKEPTDEEKPVIKKKLATAKAIDKTQAKRLVKPVRKKSIKLRKVVKAVKPTREARDIGVEVALPGEGCEDPNCPFHGKLSVRGQIINGIVVTTKMDKTTIVQREIKRYIPKYERYEKRTHHYAVHNPPCLNVQRGDLVKIMECRPLSKSKSFVVIEKM